MHKLYHVRLSPAELHKLRNLLRDGDAPPRVLNRAHVLVLAHEGRTDSDIAEAVRVGATTVHRLRRRFAADGLHATLYERPRPGGPPKLRGEHRALVRALYQSAPPVGKSHWTLQQLADELVALGAVDTVSTRTVRRVLASLQ